MVAMAVSPNRNGPSIPSPLGQAPPIPVPSLKAILGILWASPNTALGLLIGGGGVLFGAKVRRVGRAIEFYGGGIQWLLHRLPDGQFILALTLGHVVLGQTDATLDISRRHEAVHIAQYERWGPFLIPAYLLGSLAMWVAGKRAYRDNPFEREAYDIDGGEHDA